MYFIKRFFESKMLRLALFLFMFFFIFKIIDHILIFFNINKEMGYIYFMWFTVLFLLFVLLPIDKSYFKIFNKVPTATTPNTSSSRDASRDDGRGPSRDDGRGPSRDDGRGASRDDGRGASRHDGRDDVHFDGSFLNNGLYTENTQSDDNLHEQVLHRNRRQRNIR
jgi:hypothetical protein